MIPTGVLPNGQSCLRRKVDVTGLPAYAPIQRNSMYVQTVRRSIYTTRLPDDQNTLNRQSASTNDALRYPLHGPVTVWVIYLSAMVLCEFWHKKYLLNYHGIFFKCTHCSCYCVIPLQFFDGRWFFFVLNWGLGLNPWKILRKGCCSNSRGVKFLNLYLVTLCYGKPENSIYIFMFVKLQNLSMQTMSELPFLGEFGLNAFSQSAGWDVSSRLFSDGIDIWH